MEKYDYIVYSKSSSAKYINAYKLGKEHSELHITDNQDIDVCIYFDREDFEKLISVFWSFGYSGKDRSCIQIFGYKDRNSRVLLKHLIMNDYINNIVPLNRNPCDFRKCNLSIGDNAYKTQNMKQKQNKDLPNNIFYMKQKDGRITGYKRHIKEGNEVKVICFGIRKYKTLENCFNAAIQYKQ